VRGNHILHCGQAGIVGSLGCAFSTITGNEIHDIRKNHNYGGCETAGIKLHGAVDVVIANNHIYNCEHWGGIWLDWMGQGARISGNLMHDNSNDLMFEVNHGPMLIDNNILLSQGGIRDASGGGAYVHNLVLGVQSIWADLAQRQTPAFLPHSIDVIPDDPSVPVLEQTLDAMFGATVDQHDDRFYNNLFVKTSATAAYDQHDFKIKASGNVYLAGAKASKQDCGAIVAETFDPGVKLTENTDGWWLEMHANPDWRVAQKRELVTSERLGKAVVPDVPFEHQDGKPYQLDQDYLGHHRNKATPAPGPFGTQKGERVRIKVWPKHDQMMKASKGVGQPETASGRWTIRSERPAEKWQDAFVTGNGRQGTMIMGRPDNEQIIFVHEELFIRKWDRDIEAVADIAHLLPEVRRKIDGGVAKAAESASREAARLLREKGAWSATPVTPHPAFDLRIVHNGVGRTSGYERQLNLETGEARSRWVCEGEGVEQRVFSSRADNVNVVSLRATGSRKLDLSLSLAETPGRTGDYEGLDLSKVFRSVTSDATTNSLYFHADYARVRGGYEGVARVSTKGGMLTREGDRLSVSDADEVLVVLRVHLLDDGSSSERSAIENELAALPAQYQELLKPHADSHGEMFRRVTLDLGCGDQWASTSTEKFQTDSASRGVSPLFLEQTHAMGRYLLISTSGKYPAPLQGIWGGDWKPAWSGGFVLDSNLNLAISAASMGNLPECAESYFGYVERILPGWRLNARKFLGCRGFLVPHYSDPETGHLAHFAGYWAWMYWPGGGGWNIRPFYDYALLNGDREFMKNRVLPLYLEMGDFYEDYLVKDDEGIYHITPGISPENWPPNRIHELALKDTTFDIAVAREVFQILIELGETFDSDPEKIASWKQVRSNLVSYRINKDGALAEWAPEEYVDNYGHRHSSHLYPIYPGMEFQSPGSDPALLQAARVALDRRFEVQTRSAHGLIHVALMAARLKDVDKVRKNLNLFARRNYHYASLVTSHDPDQIYNLDASLSLPRLLMEMLIFSRPGHLDLMPAWPKEYSEGSIKGVLVRGGHKIDISWSAGELTSFTLYAGCDDRITVSYGDETRSLDCKAGKNYSFNVLERMVNK
jgi:alpha-L-fucosidase 2